MIKCIHFNVSYLIAFFLFGLGESTNNHPVKSSKRGDKVLKTCALVLRMSLKIPATTFGELLGITGKILFLLFAFQYFNYYIKPIVKIRNNDS